MHKFTEPQAIDRLADSYRLLRSMYFSLLEVAAEHFANLVVMTPATSSEASSCLGGDPIATGIAALQTAASRYPEPRAVKSAGPMLELIKKAGGDVEPALAVLRQLHEMHARIATDVAAFTLDDATDVDEALIDYCMAIEEAEGEPLLGYCAWRLGQDEAAE